MVSETTLNKFNRSYYISASIWNWNWLISSSEAWFLHVEGKLSRSANLSLWTKMFPMQSNHNDVQTRPVPKFVKCSGLRMVVLDLEDSQDLSLRLCGSNKWVKNTSLSLSEDWEIQAPYSTPSCSQFTVNRLQWDSNPRPLTLLILLNCTSWP